jgi:hypothetical protein
MAAILTRHHPNSPDLPPHVFSGNNKTKRASQESALTSITGAAKRSSYSVQSDDCNEAFYHTDDCNEAFYHTVKCC